MAQPEKQRELNQKIYETMHHSPCSVHDNQIADDNIQADWISTSDSKWIYPSRSLQNIRLQHNGVGTGTKDTWHLGQMVQRHVDRKTRNFFKGKMTFI